MKINPKDNKILQRIILKSKQSDIFKKLSTDLTPTDLQSLLLYAYKQRASTLSPSDVLRQYNTNRFTKTTNINPIESMKFDTLAFSLLPDGYQTIELSPVSPLGTSSVLGPVDQNNVITTIRNTEVLSDPTNVMALECAVRRKNIKSDKSNNEEKLCCSHRLTRAQLFEGPASFAHFRLLSLCRAGYDTGSYTFEKNAMIEFIDYYIRLLKKANTSGWNVKKILTKLFVLSVSIQNKISTLIKQEIEKLHPDVIFEEELRIENPGNYYIGLRFNIFGTNSKGEDYLLVDGGLTDWTQRLLNNRKERFMTSGMGSERFLVCFK